MTDMELVRLAGVPLNPRHFPAATLPRVIATRIKLLFTI